MTDASRTPQQTAEFVRDGMFANDNASKGLG
ncbi:phenylacetic acid degradation protein PaaD, partial [Pseudomonas sp. FW300-N1A1]